MIKVSFDNIEETKKKYEDEIVRLTALANSYQEFYQQKFRELENQKQAVAEEFNNKMSEVTIGIERLRGAYTALTDISEGKDPTLVVNGMAKDEVPPTLEEKDIEEDVNTDEDKNNISEEVKEKAHKAVAEAIKRDLVTPYEEFAKSELGKETAIKNVDKVVEEKVVEEKVEEKVESLTPEEMKALQEVMKENTVNAKSEKEVKTEPTVDPSTIPDYLKEQYEINE